MIPSIDERLASLIRALSDVILPALPDDAGLAREQAQLGIGHLMILRGQIDPAPVFEAEELADARALGEALGQTVRGGAASTAALAALGQALAEAGPDRASRMAINAAIAALVSAVASDGSGEARAALHSTILRHEAARAEKDRRWALPFGFDSI